MTSTASLQAVAIDLDGTLVDSLPDLTAAVQATLRALGLQVLPAAKLRSLVGDGIDTLVERALASSLDRVPDTAMLVDAIARCRATYRTRLFVESRLYPGVMSGLDAMRSAGLYLCCVTNKASTLSVPLLAAAGLDRHLGRVFSADSPERRKPRPALLLEACEALRMTPGKLLMIGDSRHDVGAARAAGCRVIAVDYRYDAGVAGHRPDHLAASFTEAASLALAARSREE